MAELLQASGVTFAYDDRAVVSDVSISLTAGEMVALFGPNGSGKSTLIQLLLGTLRGRGKIQWRGREIAAIPRRELAKLVAYLPQSPSYEPSQSVFECISLGRLPFWGAFGIESQDDVEVVARVAADLGLSDLLNRRMNSLSGGQRQRVFVARCLVQEPRALLLDEPATFLDLRHQLDLHQLLRQLTKEHQLAVMMASHDLNLSSLHADRAIILDAGKKVADGPPDSVLTPELLARVYGVPMKRVAVEGSSHLIVSP
jgi:iron complex transport system ATP-binding protein